VVQPNFQRFDPPNVVATFLRVPGTIRLARNLFVLIFVLMPLLGPVPAVGQGGKTRVLRSIRELNQLSSIDARNKFPVEVEAVATYVDPEWGLLFIQDDTGAVYVDVHGISSLCPVSSRVRVVAVTGAGDVGTVLENPRVECLGSGVLPIAERRNLADIAAKSADSRFVLTQGTLRPSDQTWPRISYRIVDANTSALVVVPQPSNVQSQGLVGSTVRVRGVSGVQIDNKGKVVGSLLFVNRIEDIQADSAEAHGTNGPVVVVNKSNPRNDLSMADLRSILLGERLYWNGTQKIVLLLPKIGTPERETTLRLLGLEEAAYEKQWSDKAKQGQVDTAPVAAAGGFAVNVVAERPEAIAIVPAADVKTSVKVISIDGHMPRDSAYPVH
jgi:hypothetical protein